MWVTCCIVASSARGRNKARAWEGAWRVPGGEDGDTLNLKWDAQGQSYWEGDHRPRTQREWRSWPCDIWWGEIIPGKGSSPELRGWLEWAGEVTAPENVGPCRLVRGLRLLGKWRAVAKFQAEKWHDLILALKGSLWPLCWQNWRQGVKVHKGGIGLNRKGVHAALWWSLFVPWLFPLSQPLCLPLFFLLPKKWLAGPLLCQSTLCFIVSA